MHERDEQREAGQRHRDERQRRSPRSRRRAVSASKPSARSVSPCASARSMRAGRRRRCAGPSIAQAGQMRAAADLGEQAIVSRYLTANTIGAPSLPCGEIGVGADRDRRDDCRPAEKMFDQDGAAARFAGILHRRSTATTIVRQRRKPAAQQIERRRKSPRSRLAAIVGRVGMGVFDAVVAVDDDDDVVVEADLAASVRCGDRPIAGRSRRESWRGASAWRRRFRPRATHAAPRSAIGLLDQLLFATRRRLHRRAAPRSTPRRRRRRWRQRR